MCFIVHLIISVNLIYNQREISQGPEASSTDRKNLLVIQFYKVLWCFSNMVSYLIIF